MPRRIRQPESVRLELTQGDWLLVKKRLTAGETQTLFTRMVKAMNPGEKIDIDPMEVGRSQAAVYLLDWGTFTDTAGKPLVIRGQSHEAIGLLLHELEQEDYAEIVTAVQNHVAAMEREREQEKNGTDGAKESSALSPSPVTSAGAMSGSTN